MTLLLRDDDTSFFTQPEDLELAYSSIWGKAMVFLAVTPFQGGPENFNVPHEHLKNILKSYNGKTGNWITNDNKLIKKYKNYPIGENKNLIVYLRKKLKEGHIRILLHGYSHEMANGLPEFVGASALKQKIIEGRRHLEEVFGVKIKTFVPPWNQLSKSCLLILIGERMNLLINGDFTLRPFIRLNPWEMGYWGIKRFKYRLKTKNPNEKCHPFPFILKFPTFQGLGCYPLAYFQNSKKLIQEFENVLKQGGTFGLSTHFWELSTIQHREKLNEFISYYFHHSFPKLLTKKMAENW